MCVLVTEFQTYAVHINDCVKDSDERTHHLQIIPATLNPLRFITNPRYM